MRDSTQPTTAAAQAWIQLVPRVKAVLGDGDDGLRFVARLERYFPVIHRLFYTLYGQRSDAPAHFDRMLMTAARMYCARGGELKTLDRQRESDNGWFQTQKVVGAVCYVDLFAGTFASLREKLWYLEEIGINYLHLMPLFRSPEGHNDGGYAVSSFHETDPKLGTMGELAALVAEWRAHGISLVLDFVFNHTSDEHEWALRALRGEQRYQNFYYMFPDRTLPDQYEARLREVFPDSDPGNFTYVPEINRWVWTTFHHYQWDLNYRNPDVFNAMLGEMLFLANQGFEILRLDAVPFIWKASGTNCENLPEAHSLIQLYNALIRVAAPAVLFKSEAIVHPDDVASYIGWNECPISYNPTLMALLWEALATGDVNLLRHTMSKRFEVPADTRWVNYVRSHDDIGWSFADEDAAALGIRAFDHRQFLNAFYCGEFPGSFAAGLPFNFNPDNRDMRISGTTASLAGLEQAVTAGDVEAQERALLRIILLYSIVIGSGGIPLIYLGDEIASTNDYSYRDDPLVAEDSRWAHRPHFDWKRAGKRRDQRSAEEVVFQNIRKLIAIRKATEAFADDGTLFFDTGSDHVLGFVRNKTLLILSNFSEHEQELDWNILRAYWPPGTVVEDLITGARCEATGSLKLPPYRFVWLKRAGD